MQSSDHEVKYKNIKLLYPHKKDSFNFRMWKKYYSGASGLMGLKIRSKNKNSVIKFVNSLKLFGYGYSWGGFKSLVTARQYKRDGKWVHDGKHLIRLNIGLEDTKDLISDIKSSFSKL